VSALEIEFLGEFESIFEAALVNESGDQSGTFGEITLDKKISRYCPFKGAFFYFHRAERTNGIYAKDIHFLNQSYKHWIHDVKCELVKSSIIKPIIHAFAS
jgi:hypothetical protein